jgi:hypothetical protein
MALFRPHTYEQARAARIARGEPAKAPKYTPAQRRAARRGYAKKQKIKQRAQRAERAAMTAQWNRESEVLLAASRAQFLIPAQETSEQSRRRAIAAIRDGTASYDHNED